MPEKSEDNVVFVGKKASITYVLAVLTQFSDGQKEVIIKSRGKSISRAVDVAETVKRRFINDLQIGEVSIGTEEKELPDKSKINVSTISICLKK